MPSAILVPAGSSFRNVVPLGCDSIAAGARAYIPVRSRIEVLRCALPLVLNGEYFLPASAFRNAELGGPPVLSFAPAAEPLPATPRLESPLTERQAEVLAMLAAGKSNKEIARELDILEGTIKLHVKAILRKLNVRNRTEAAMTAARAGYLPPLAGRAAAANA